MERLIWQLGEVIAIQEETARVKSITLSVPNWKGHRPGQHVDVRLTAKDGYQVERSYSIASAPEERQHVKLTVERQDGGEVSPILLMSYVWATSWNCAAPLGATLSGKHRWAGRSY